MSDYPKIKYISLVFENCEDVDLAPDMFDGLAINNINKGYWINCFQYKSGEIIEYLNCHSFSIMINHKGLAVILDNKKTLKERLIHHDISHVYIYFENGTSEYISVPWGEEQYTNTKQNYKEHEDGINIIIEN